MIEGTRNSAKSSFGNEHFSSKATKNIWFWRNWIFFFVENFKFKSNFSDFHKKKIIFCRCWYPRTRREVHHHLCVPTLWRVPRTTSRSSTVRCGSPKTPATVPRSRQLTTSMDQGKYRHHASKCSVIRKKIQNI